MKYCVFCLSHWHLSHQPLFLVAVHLDVQVTGSESVYLASYLLASDLGQLLITGTPLFNKSMKGFGVYSLEASPIFNY